MNLLLITQKVNIQDQLLGFFIEWLKRLAAKFEKITVLCLEKGEYNLPSNVEVISLGKEKNNFQFFPLCGIPRSGTIFNFQSILKKIKYAPRFYWHLWRERKNYQAVFVHMNPIWVCLGGPFWRLAGKKTFFWYTSGGVTAKLKLAEKLAHVIFTASPESFRWPSKKIIVTGHGINTDLFRPNSKFKIQNSKLKILSVGRIASVKNYEILVEATRILADKGIDFSVTLIGEPALEKDKNYESRIKNQVKSCGLESKFDFAGKINQRDLPQYYQSHDIFVHLSRTGSLDKTLLEAMACDLKVVSCNDAARAFLPPDLIFEQDDPKDLARKICHALKQPAEENLREYVVKNHNLDRLIDIITHEISN